MHSQSHVVQMLLSCCCCCFFSLYVLYAFVVFDSLYRLENNIPITYVYNIQVCNRRFSHFFLECDIYDVNLFLTAKSNRIKYTFSHFFYSNFLSSNAFFVEHNVKHISLLSVFQYLFVCSFVINCETYTRHHGQMKCMQDGKKKLPFFFQMRTGSRN